MHVMNFFLFDTRLSHCPLTCSDRFSVGLMQFSVHEIILSTITDNFVYFSFIWVDVISLSFFFFQIVSLGHFSASAVIAFTLVLFFILWAYAQCPTTYYDAFLAFWEMLFVFNLNFFWWDWGLNSGLLHLQSWCSSIWATPPVRFTLVMRWGLMNYLPGLASNCQSPNLSFPSS
jgi:hypothetical protein